MISFKPIRTHSTLGIPHKPHNTPLEEWKRQYARYYYDQKLREKQGHKTQKEVSKLCLEKAPKEALRFTCQICDYTTTNKSSFKRHISTKKHSSQEKTTTINRPHYRLWNVDKTFDFEVCFEKIDESHNTFRRLFNVETGEKDCMHSEVSALKDKSVHETPLEGVATQ